MVRQLYGREGVYSQRQQSLAVPQVRARDVLFPCARLLTVPHPTPRSLWHSFNVAVPPDWGTMQIVMARTVCTLFSYMHTF